MNDLADAAKRALATLGAPDGRSTVRRLAVDVERDGRTEIVSFMLDGGELRWTSTDPDPNGAAIRAALAWLANEPEARPTSASVGDMPKVSVAVAPLSPRAALALALEELVTAVARAGLGRADGSPTVEDAFARFLAAAPKSPPIGVSRWVGRLRAALAAKDEVLAVRLLDGANQAVDDLRGTGEDGGSAYDRAMRATLWAGPDARTADTSARLTDRTVIEIAREVVQGAEAQAITRRYLVCVHTGEVFREDGLRAETGLSVGPCPRRISIGLAELASGSLPRVLRVLQYTVSQDVTQHDWLKAQRLAHSRFARLADEYKRALRENSALAEPFAVVAPSRIATYGDVVVLLDHEGMALPLSGVESGASIEVLAQLMGDKPPTWVAGRLTDHNGRLILHPLSVGVPTEGAILHRRVA